MRDRRNWMRKVLRNSFAIFVTSTLAACGSESTPDNNDQLEYPIVNDPNSRNTAPVIEGPELVTISHLGKPLIVGLYVSDADNDPVTGSWTVESFPANGNLVIEPYFGLVDAFISATVVGEYVISVIATDGFASTKRIIGVQVIDSPPPIFGLHIDLTELNSYSDAYAEFDNSPHVYSHYPEVDYFWRVNNGYPVGWNSPILLSSYFDRGDRLSVEVVARDGVNEVRAMSAEIVVANAPPQISSLIIKPYYASANDDLYVDVSGVFDPEGDPVSITYQWFLNGEPMTDQRADTLLRGIASAGDEVYIEVTLSDGTDSAVHRSSELKLTNTP